MTEPFTGDNDESPNQYGVETATYQKTQLLQKAVISDHIFTRPRVIFGSCLPHQSQQRCTGSNKKIASCHSEQHSEQQTLIDFLAVLGGSTKNTVSLENFSSYSYFVFLKGS